MERADHMPRFDAQLLGRPIVLLHKAPDKRFAAILEHASTTQNDSGSSTLMPQLIDCHRTRTPVAKPSPVQRTTHGSRLTRGKRFQIYERHRRAVKGVDDPVRSRKVLVLRVARLGDNARHACSLRRRQADERVLHNWNTRRIRRGKTASNKSQQDATLQKVPARQFQSTPSP